MLLFQFNRPVLATPIQRLNLVPTRLPLESTGGYAALLVLVNGKSPVSTFMNQVTVGRAVLTLLSLLILIFHWRLHKVLRLTAKQPMLLMVIMAPVSLLLRKRQVLQLACNGLPIHRLGLFFFVHHPVMVRWSYYWKRQRMAFLIPQSLLSAIWVNRVR